jgi:hypothetical protein
MRRALLLLLLTALPVALVACPPPVDDDDATDAPCNNDDVPEILVQAVDDGQPVGFPVTVLAQVTDGDGVSTVSLYFRTEGQPAFTFDFMSNEATGDPTIYAAEIPANAVQDPGVDFYVRATDAVSGCQEEAFAPEEAYDGTGWYQFTTQLDLQPLPFYEFFEADGACGTEGNELEDLGWEVSIEEFYESIHAWRLSDRSSLSGSCGVYHSEGIPGGFWECPPPDGVGTIRRDNWLISPPLDLTGKDEIAVRWFERHVEGGICSETHGLYVSTGSPDPAAGEYVAVVEELPFPGSAWQSSGWHDLSEFLGNDRVYVALHYFGGAAGAWFIDDLYVGEPLADLQLDSAGPLDSSVAPGSAAVELDVTIVNVSETYGAAALTATLSESSPDVVVTLAGSTFPAVAAGATATSETSFIFDVLESHPDNAFLDFALTLEDEASHVWTVPIRLLMGEESTVEVSWTLQPGAAIDLELGHGPAEAPSFAVAATSDELGDGPWTFDVTEQAAALPPGPGARRWHLRATGAGAAPSVLDDAVFVVGGVEYRPDPADVPAELLPGDAIVVLIPPPPELSVEGWIADPDPVAPGVAVTLSELILRNDGSATDGPLGCVMGSSHDDATGFSTSPVTFGATVIESGESRIADESFSFEIDVGHIDATPIPLTLLCTDAADTLTHTFDLEVPYAHPATASVRIDDEDCGGCDEDGLADAGETVQIFVTAINDGAFATDGALTAGVVDTATGTTTDYTFVPETLEFGPDPLDPEGTMESTNSFEVSLGEDVKLGDSIVFELAWTAGADVWNELLVLEVTGLPWTDCPATADAEGDPVNGYAFDIAGCAFRSDGERLQVRLDSYTPFDASTLFVDFFFYEVPDIYSIETVGGSPDFETGCVFGSDAVETEPITITAEGNSVSARILLDDIAELGNNTQVAFGAGSCPDIYFCDTYPPNVLLFNVAEGTYNCDGNGFISLNW